MNTRKTLFLGCGALVALFVGTNVASAALDPVGSFTVRRGATGAAGADGKSAYQIWQDAGNTGSEADFLASLVGKDGAAGQDGAACQSVLTATQCGPDLTQKCPVESKSGVIYTKTDCNNANPTQDVVYNGTDGTNGCATTLSKSTSTDSTTGKKTVTVTAKDCNNQTIWTETVEDGTDAPDQCEGLSAADKATRIVKRTEEYKDPTSNARGYMEITTVNCNDVQTVTRQDDTCGEVRNQSITSSMKCVTGEAVMSCRKQTDQNRYYVCEARADSNAGVVPLGASMDADKDQLQTEINKKLSTTDAESTYLNKTDAGNTYLATANLGTALKDTALKADVASAVAGSGALTSVNNKVSTLETTVGDSTSGLVQKVNANTTTIGNSTSGLVKDVADAKAKASANEGNIATLSGTVSNHTSQIANKLNTADFGTKANSWASTQTTLAKQADLITVEQAANNAQDTADGHASQIATLETAVGVGSGVSSRNNILTRLSTAETDVTNLKTSVDGTCESTGGRSGCTQSLESRVRALEAAVAALQSN